MPIEVRLQDVRRHLDYFCFLAGQHSPLDPGSDKWAHLRAVVDGAQQGKPTCIGMAFTTQGWQVLPHKSERLEASTSWLSQFATTTLQLNNVGAVIYGRGRGHIPETKGYTMGLLMWWGRPQGQIYFEEFRSATTSREGLGGISLRQRHPDD